MPYSYDHPRPAVTVDIALLRPGEAGNEILLIRRGNAPFAGAWALPGGFVDADEDLPAAAQRELAEETGLVGIALEQLRAYGRPGRDPRGHTISIVFTGSAGSGTEAQAGSDAADAHWFALDALPTLAFDHDEIIGDLRQQVTAGQASVERPVILPAKARGADT
jgi:8-oxo-dGTP diphosphatase